MSRLDDIRASMKADADFVANVLANLPSDVTHNELLAMAVDIIVDACPRVKREIWGVKASDINPDLLEDGTLSSGEKLIAQAAISMWTYGLSSIELWTVLNKLDVANSRNFLRGVMLIHYWDASEREKEERDARAIAKRLFGDE